MKYEGIVYRPPSEAMSLIIQVTLGCAHNKCTFCSMYKEKKFKIKSLEEIKKELYDARNHYKNVKKIFLADGDALILKTKDLIEIFRTIKYLFPECQRIGMYATPKDLLNKTLEELKTLKKEGLGIIYMGIESGDDEILKQIQKGANSKEIIEAGKKAKKSNILLSVTMISGLGGREKSKQHAIGCADVITKINPDYASFLTLMLEESAPLYDDFKKGNFYILSAKEVMKEIRTFIEYTNPENCVFRSNHASNYVALGGILNQEKDRLLKEIDFALKEEDFRPDFLRGL